MLSLRWSWATTSIRSAGLTEEHSWYFFPRYMFSFSLMKIVCLCATIITICQWEHHYLTQRDQPIQMQYSFTNSFSRNPTEATSLKPLRKAMGQSTKSYSNHFVSSDALFQQALRDVSPSRGKRFLMLSPLWSHSSHLWCQLTMQYLTLWLCHGNMCAD